MMPQRRISIAAFLSTSPLRGTTEYGLRILDAQPISIHVPLAGDDAAPHASPQPAAPFLSTSPLRGTTVALQADDIRPPDFYPRPPCGGRRQM